MIKILVFVILVIGISAQAGGKQLTSNRKEQGNVSYRQAAFYAKTNFEKPCGLDGYKWDSLESVEQQIVEGINYTIVGKVSKEGQSRTIQMVLNAPSNKGRILNIISCSVKFP